MARLGRWVRRSRDILAMIESLLPPDRRGAESVIKEHYPFGERAHHPYKVWRKEVRAFLDKRYGPKEQPLRFLRIDPRWECGVLCPWCRAVCLVCSEPRERLSRLCNERPRDVDKWRAWAKEAEKDATEGLILADWLEVELGMPEEAKAIRASGVVPLRWRKVEAKSPAPEPEESDECPF
jgi:hypothetical protein